MSIRTFIAVDVTPSEKFQEFQEALRNVNPRLKYVDGENLHMTLKFLGDIQEDKIYDIEMAMIRSVDGMQTITFSLRGTGVFPNEKSPRVIWVGVEGGESIIDIAESLEDELEDKGFGREERSFVPHITVARVRRGRDKQQSLSREVLSVVKQFDGEDFGTVKVDRIKLVKSQLTSSGPVYSTAVETKFF